MSEQPEKMVGAYLPGDSTVEFKEYEIPELRHGEVLIRTKASTICGSDIRCIYNEHWSFICGLCKLFFFKKDNRH